MNKIKTINVTNETTSEKIEIPAAISQIFYNDKNNLNIVTDEDDIVNGKGGKINIESANDIQIKPGDDVIFYSHHREASKQDEVAVKFTDGDDVPVKLQVNASSMTLTTKDKDNSDGKDEEFNINVNTGKSAASENKKGYLKVRARAIDLRCEEHGGVAIQPKGYDSDNHMNKIKFEHGGGDGLEFATFNTEKTSIFTDEYRFNKDGEVKMASRELIDSDKADANDATTAKKYVKQDDDFYDVIDDNDVKTTWKDIITAGNAFESGKVKLGDRNTIEVEHKVTKKGNVDGGEPVVKYVFTKNLPNTYTELVSNGGTITEEEYNALRDIYDERTSETISITFREIMEILKDLKTMKDGQFGPWTPPNA